MKTLVAILLLVGVGDASAGVGLHWNGCSSPITNYNVEPYSAGMHDLVVTLDGYGFDANEIDVTLIVYDPCSSDGGFIPQAWRFDAGGCQSGRLSIDRPASLDGCEGLVPLGGATIESVTAAPFNTTIGQHNDPVTYPAIFIRIAQTFPTKQLLASNRYVLGRIRLDMANTVAGVDPAGKACGCGSAERQIAFFGGTIGGPSGSGPLQGGQGLIEDNAYWAGMDFCVIDKPSPPATNWGADPLCLTTSSTSRSWGAVKAHYR
jgi:hypothetical protein